MTPKIAANQAATHEFRLTKRVFLSNTIRYGHFLSFILALTASGVSLDRVKLLETGVCYPPPTTQANV